MPKPTPQNMSAKEFADRASSNGATVHTLTAKERKADQKQHEADRKETEKALDKAWYGVKPKKEMKGH